MVNHGMLFRSISILHYVFWWLILAFFFKLFLYFIVGSDQIASPEMEIVVEETATVKEVSWACFKSFYHYWVRSAAPGQLCVTSGYQDTLRQRKCFNSTVPAGKTILIFCQVVKGHTCFYLRINVAQLLCAWLDAPFTHCTPQHNTQSSNHRMVGVRRDLLKGPTLLQQAGTPSARWGSWQNLPQFSVAHPTLNTQNWGERSQGLYTGQRKQASLSTANPGSWHRVSALMNSGWKG